MADGHRTVALIVAAGEGVRAGRGVPKQYAALAGGTVLGFAIDALRSHPSIDDVRVVIGAGQEHAYAQAIGCRSLPPPIIGGATRRESVRNGLEALAAGVCPDRVLIHDAARPFVPPAVVDRLLDALDTDPGAIPGLPVVDTLARADGTLGATIPREGLVRVQTPQAFHFADILVAHRTWDAAEEPTDDAQVARAAGCSVAVVAGDAALEKLTHPEDFAAAEARLARSLVTRTGMGFDVHAFGAGDRLWLGGIEIAHSHGLVGHSDADIALHALTDALLGAIAAGDIGTHFPPSDPQWRGAPSACFLEHARDLVTGRGGRIDHVDLTIICEAPKIGPHRAGMRARVAELLRVSESRISIKATTTERLGFTGRAEGIAAQAIATIRLPEDL